MLMGVSKRGRRILTSAVVAVAALIAVAETAHATSLTSPSGTTVTPTIKAETEGHLVLHNPIAKLECASILEGKVESHGEGVSATGQVTSLSFSSCTSSWHMTVVSGGTLAIAASSEGNGTVSSSGMTLEATRLGITCRYATSSTAVGTLTGGAPATIDISASIPFHSGSPLCGSGSTAWTGSYKVVSPESLIVDEKEEPQPTTPVRYIGKSDQIRLPVNAANNITGAITMVALVNPEGTGEHYYITLLNEAGSPTGYKFFENNEGHLKLSNGFGGDEDPQPVPDSGWQLVAVTKGAGEVKPRFHIYSYTSKKWTHRNAAEEVPNGGNVSGGKIRLGGLGEEEYAAAALYSRALSDGEVEGLLPDFADWLEREPTGMWILNQPDVTKPVLDETGGGADEILEETFGTEVHQASAPPSDDPDGTIFRGDLQRGMNHEWEEEQLTGATAALSIKELSPPLSPEKYFGRFSLSSGDSRSELASGLHLFEGEDVYIRFLVRLSKEFPVEESVSVWGERIWALHQDEVEGSPPLGLHIRDSGAGQYALEDSEGTAWWLGPEIDAETWHEFVVRVNHSQKSEVGFAEVWMDGVQQKMSNGLNRRYGATMLDEYNYPKTGYYRDDEIAGTGVVDIAGYRIAKSLADLP